MIGGRIASFSERRFKLTASLASGFTGAFRAQASLNSTHATGLPDLTSTLLDIVLTFSRSVVDNTTTEQKEIFVRLGSQVYTQTDNSLTGVSVELILKEPRWHVVLEDLVLAWQVTYDSAELFINSALAHTFAGSRIVSTYFAPAGIPLQLTTLSADAVAHDVIDNSVSADDPWSFTSSVVMTASGGFEDRLGTTVTRYPIRFRIVSPIPAECDLNIGRAPAISGGDTANVSMEVKGYKSYSQGPWSFVECTECTYGPALSPAIFRYRDIRMIVESESASATPIPDVPKQFVRWHEGNTTLLYRAKLPRTTHRRSTTSGRTRYECDNDFLCYEPRNDAVLEHEFADEYLGNLRDSYSPVEEPLLKAVCSPYSWSYNFWDQLWRHIQVVQPGICPIIEGIGPDDPPQEINPCRCPPLNFQTETTLIGASIAFPDIDNNALPYYRHDVPLLRYYNTRACPFWSYFLWWMDWPLGAPLQPAAKLQYWIPFHQQWIDHPQLPSPERTRERNQLILDPVSDSPYLPFVEYELLGVPTIWPGITRFDLLPPTAIESVQLDSASAPRWSVSNAAVVFASNIQVTPTSTTSTVTFDLTRYDIKPYLYPAIADAVRVSLTGMVDSVTVELISAEGDATVLPSEASDPTLYRYRADSDSVYAGSWAQSYAAQLTGYQETPNDLQTSGRSASVMNDIQRRVLYELLGNKTPAQLRITVQQTVPMPYTLQYPTFYRDSGRMTKAYPETAHTQAVVDGEHLWRHGALRYLLTTPIPQPRPPHGTPTVYDAFCLRNHLYCAKNYQDDVLAEADVLYDRYEWTGQFADLRMDTRAVILPFKALPREPRFLLINAYREVPSLAAFPTRKFDWATLAFTGDWGQWRYILAPIHRYYAATRDLIHLDRVEYDAAGNETARLRLTEYHESFNNAVITRHAVPLENTEVITDWAGNPVQSPRFYIVRTVPAQDLARVTPFHGYSAVIARFKPPAVSAPLVIDSRRQWLHWARNEFLTNHHLLTYANWQSREYPPAIVDLAYEPRATALFVLTQVGAQYQLWRSRDAGWTANEVIQLTADACVVETVSPHGLIVVIYRDSNAVYRRESLDGGVSWSPPVQVVLDNANMTSKPLALRYDSRTNLLLMSYQRAENTMALAESRDFGFKFTTMLP